MRLIKLNLKLWIKIYFKRDYQEMKKIMNLKNKTINNNIFNDKSNFSYFTPSKIKMTKSLTKIGLISLNKKK